MKFKKRSSRILKNSVKRVVSTLIVFNMLLSEPCVPDVFENLDLSCFGGFITASAEGELPTESPSYINYTNSTTKEISIPIEEFVEYSIDCQNNPWSHKDDKITITSINKTDFFEPGFAGLGTDDWPFAGSIAISGGNNICLNLDAPLFNCVYDNVVLNNNTPLQMSRCYYSGLGTDETTPMIAKKVKNVEGSATWNIDVQTPSDSDHTYLDTFGGFIGIMESGTELNLSVSMNTSENDSYSVAIDGSDDLGLVCGHMQSGAKLSFFFEGNRALTEISTTGGDVGGLVGEMESGSIFNLIGTGAVTSGIYINTSANGNYAGGLVGRNTGGTFTVLAVPENSENVFADASAPTSYTISQKITGTSGAGGVYGFYTPNSALTGENSFDTSKYTFSSCEVNGNGYTGGLFGVLDSTVDVTINGSGTVTTVHNTNNDSGKCTAYGGLIGQYKTNDKARTLSISSVTAVSTKTADASFYGGGIGKIDPETSSYVEFSSFTAITSNAGALTFGGLAASADNAFIKTTGSSISASAGYKGGGLVGSLKNGVLQICGSNPVSGSSADPGDTEVLKVGKIVGYRDNGLVFMDQSASCTCGNASVDDVGSWGGVIKLDGFTTPANVLSVSGHDVTIGTSEYAFTPIADKEQFAVTALRMQIDGTESTVTEGENTVITGNPFVTFANDTMTSANLLTTDITLNGDVDLTNTGIYGLTRDNDISSSSFTKCIYAGTFGGAASKTITFATGTIYRHKYNGLIAKLNGGTVQNVTFAGNITVNAKVDLYVGTAAARATGAFTANNIISGTAISYTGSTTPSLYIGGILGEADSSIGAINVSNCTVNANITGSSADESTCIGGVIGRISHDSDEAVAWDLSNVTVSGTISNSTGARIGGVIGVIPGSYTTNSAHRVLNLNGVTIDGLSVSGISSSAMGGLLGYSWLKTDVNVGVKTTANNTTTVTAVTVQNNSTDSSTKPTVSNSDTGDVGGMIYRATGKWTVNDLDVKNIVISSSGSLGMIVNKGISQNDSSFYSDDARSALYLCLPSGYIYNLTIDNTSNITGSVFDELCAYTAPDSDSVLKNGNGVISINEKYTDTTTNPASLIENKPFKTDGTNPSGSYHAQTTYGAAANPNSRYYYNLDTIQPSQSDWTTYQTNLSAYEEYIALSAEDQTAYVAEHGSAPTQPTPPNASNALMSWGVHRYACINIQDDFTDVFGNVIPNEEYDLKNYSWYPIDIDQGTTVNGTFKFYSHEFELSEDEKYTAEYTADPTTAFDRTNFESNQHYTMHCALFRNVTSGHTLTVGTTVFQGDVGLLGTGTNTNSGALICGTVQGASNTSKAAVEVADSGSITLDGVYVYGAAAGNTPNYAPLLINKVGSYVELTIKNISSTDKYSTANVNASTSSAPYITKDGTYPKAASSLIGNVGLSNSATGISVSFRNIKLDGRTADVTNATYNSELDTIYGSNRTIFTRSTLLNQFKYASGSTGKYEFTWDEDWKDNSGTYTHAGLGVTYGKELGYDNVNYPRTGTAPEYNTQYPNEEFYYSGEIMVPPRCTNPTNGNDQATHPYSSTFISSFLPYVYEKYDTTKKNNQLMVNHQPSNATGCGTYDDPYILTDRIDTVRADGTPYSVDGKLEVFCKWINNSNPFVNNDKIYVPLTGLSDTAITGTWCGGDDIELTFQNGVFTGTDDNNVTYNIEPNVMRTYLAGAYYKIPDNVSFITISNTESFTGLGNITDLNDEYAVFRGVIDGNNRTIINKTDAPLIASSNGSVVKDLTIEVRPTNGITLAGTQEKFEKNNSGNAAYGAVMAKIFGGDNIIDNVSVSLGTSANKTAITLSGDYAQLVPVGSYVGVIVNGGLYFRNMARTDNLNNELLYNEKLFANVNFSAVANSATDTKPYENSNTEWLYVNPIIGRVINGFAVTESGITEDGGQTYTTQQAYRPFEDGTRQYPDKTDETDETWADGHVTLQNGTKNYSITDISGSISNFTVSAPSGGGDPGDEGSTVTVSNAQSLFIISLITEAGLGTSSNGKYDDVHNLLKPYGAYKATHLAHYNNVGKAGLENTDPDYVKAATDVQVTADLTTKVPHIIKSYTPEGNVSSPYPAFNLAAFEANANELYLNLTFSNAAGSESEYFLPDGFRGLGCLLIGEDWWYDYIHTTTTIKDGQEVISITNSKWLYNNMNINSLTGNNRDISLSMNLMLYSDDNYGFPGNSTDANLKTGFGFFNALRSNYSENDSNKIKDLSIKGIVNYDVIARSTGTHLEITADTYVRPAVGGFIGAPGVDTNGDGGGGDMWIENISLNNLSVSGVLYAGGLVGCSNAAKKYSFINCSADNLEVVGGTCVGGLIGYIRHGSSNIYCDFGGNNYGIISVVSRAMSDGSKNGNTAAGALFGENYSNQNGEGLGVTVKNVNIKNATSTTKGYVGYSTVSNNVNKVRAGGVVGAIGRSSRMDISEVTVKNIDIESFYSGGMIGYVFPTEGNGDVPVTIVNSKVLTDNGAVIENTAANGTSGGIVGNWKSAAGYDLKLDTVEVNGYTIKGAANCGGLVGNKAAIANTVECDNIAVVGVSIQTNDKGGGMVGNILDGSVYGYNILVKNLSFDRYSGTGDVTSWGYIAGNNADKNIKLAGFSRQGTISVAATVGAYTEKMYGTDGYVVFADYDDKASTVQNKYFSDITGSVDNNTFDTNGTGSTKSVIDYVLIAQRGSNGTVTVKKKVSADTDEDNSGVFDTLNDLASEGNPYYSATGSRLRTIKGLQGGWVSTASDFSQVASETSFYLYCNKKSQYFKGYPLKVNGDNTLIDLVSSENSTTGAGVWYFQAVENEENTYLIYTIDNANTPQYIKVGKKSTNTVYNMALTPTESDAAKIKVNDYDSSTNILSLSTVINNTTFYIGYSGKGGMRFSTTAPGDSGDGLNSKIKIYTIPSSDRFVSENYSTSSLDPTVDAILNGTSSDQTNAASQQSAYDSLISANGFDNTNKDYEIYYIKETSIENYYEHVNAKPYVTTNPVGTIDITNEQKTRNSVPVVDNQNNPVYIEQFLTGDGVSSPTYVTSAFKHIIDDQNDGVEKAYTTCPKQLGLAANADDLKKLRSEISNSYTEFRAYFTGATASEKNYIQNFPLLIAEDTRQDTLTELINNYLRTLTNTDYNFADITKSSVFSVSMHKCEYNAAEHKFDVDVSASNITNANLKLRHSQGEHYFYMNAGSVDTQTVPQFTLMDVQFKDPGNTGKVAYHLYVPVYVRKVLRYYFNANIKSGTDYYWSAYSSKLGNPRAQGLFENLGNPVTIAMEWSYYRDGTEWADAVNGGDSLLTNYQKSLMMKQHYSTPSPWPADTTLVLVDVNNHDKLYYLDIPPDNIANAREISLSSFKDSDGNSFKPVNLIDLMTVTVASDKNGTLTDLNAATNATVTYNGTPYRPITDEDTSESLVGHRFTVTVTDPQPEKYYLSIFTKANINESHVYHYEIYSPESFSDSTVAETWRANKISDDKNTYMHLFTGDLYENDMDLRVRSAKGNQQLSAENDHLTVTMTANIRLTDTAKTNNVNGNMRTYKDNAEIYQSFLTLYDKLENVDGQSKIGIELDAGDPVASRTDYYKSGVLSLAELATVDLSLENSGATPITGVERKVSDKFIELRHNNTNLIQFLNNDSAGNAVTLQTKFDMVYSAADLAYQFPKRAEGVTANIGSSVIGYSRIASTVESAAYSATSNKKSDSTRYYIADESTAKLTYNVVTLPEDDPVGLYGSLGINAEEVENDPDVSHIDTIAIYDVTKLKNTGDYVELTFSLSKRSNYNQKLPIEDYLRGVTIYGKDGDDEDNDDDVIFLQTNAPITTGDDLRTTKETYEYKVRVNKNLLKTQPGGAYIIPIDFNVRTGNSLFKNEALGGLEYSNYKVTVSAAIYSGITGNDISNVSYDDDHIIYTNARVLTSVVE